MKPIRIIIAEDHAFFRFGLRTRLSIEPAIEIIGEVTSGQAVIQLAQETQPDLILMDLKLEGIGGIEATRQIHQILPTTHILVLTMFDDESALAALRAGARGYLLKADDVERTIEAIYAVARGERRYSKSIEDRIHRTAIGLHATEPKPLLTARQLEVLQLIAIGLSNSEIATRLTIDERTVRNKVSDIYDALHLTDKERNRRYAILRAIEYRLI